MSTALKSPADFDSLIDLITYFKDEATCLLFVEQWLHGGDIKCPHCGFDKPYRFKDGKRFKCRSCRSQFTAKIGTIFEKSPIPLSRWFAIMYLMGTNKKGLSACAISRMLKMRRPTVWFMMHRIRKAIIQDKIELDGIVQSDETFVGGKNKNRHIDKKVKYKKSVYRESPDKTPVLGMLDNNGTAKTIVLKDAKFTSIRPVIMDSIKAGSTWVTDNYLSVKTLGRYFKREVVNHHEKKYFSESGYTTNGIENFWSHLKRMLIGVYHSVSPKYLQRYCDELTFRFNTRHIGEGERFTLLLSKCNTRIQYKHLIK